MAAGITGGVIIADMDMGVSISTFKLHWPSGDLVEMVIIDTLSFKPKRFSHRLEQTVILRIAW